MKPSEFRNLFNNDFGEKEWVGEVVDNDDPEKMLRCKIRVYSLFDNLDVDMIPWAFPSAQSQFAGGNGGFGACSVPKIGTIVKVKFNNAEIYAPEYFAIQNINTSLQEEIMNDYTNAQVLCYDEDEDLKMYYTQGKGLYIYLKENIINITNENDITITNVDGDHINLMNDGTLNIKTRKNINVETSEDTIIKCKNATVDASKSIKLGKNATQKIINGTSFQTYFNTHTHVSSVPGSPTSTPSVPSDPSHLSNLASVQENP